MEDFVFAALEKCPLFAGIKRNTIDLCLSAVPHSIVDYDCYEVYALAGLPCQYADIVISGTLVCRMASHGGKLVEMTRLHEGHMIAPALLFSTDNSMPVSVETETKGKVLRMTKDSLLKLIDLDKQLRMNFIRMISDINVYLTKKTRMLSLMTVREKIAFYLNRRSKEQGSLTVTLDRSRQEIADSFGIQKFSLIRTLTEMEQEGVIKIENRAITILIPQALQG